VYELVLLEDYLMAKYCFYCGRELSNGERCQCKTSHSTESARAAASSSPPPAQKSRQKKSAAAHVPKKHFWRLKTFRDQARTLFPTFSQAIASGSQYFMRPATKIRQESLRIRRPFAFVNIILFCLLTGLLGFMLSRSGSAFYGEILTVVLGKSRPLIYDYPGYAFAAMSAFTLLLVFILSVSFYVAARFSNRKPTFRKTIDLVSLSLVYPFALELFVLVTILLGSRGSLSLLLVGFLLMGITNFLSFRNALGLSEDAVFFFLMFVYSMGYLFVSFFLFTAIRFLVSG
jgi:hypothetical protein